MAEAKHFAWNDGLPTKPDVDLLLRKWPAPVVGQRFEYEEIAAAIGVQPQSRRFWSVVRRWRECARDEMRVALHVDRETRCLFVANFDQSNDQTNAMTRSIQRKAKRQRRELAIYAGDPNLSAPQSALLEHNMLRCVVFEREGKKQLLNKLPATAVRTAPRIEPPQKAES